MKMKKNEGNLRKLFDNKERLVNERPELGHSYSQFLRDWEKYREVWKTQNKAEKSHDYFVFGASFKE